MKQNAEKTGKRIGKGIKQMPGLLAILTAMLIFALTASGAMAALTTADMTTGGVTPADMVNSLMGPGVSPSNIVFNGAPVAGGTFNGGTGIIGFEKGIILSTGKISTVIGPNTQTGATGVNGMPGDSNLDSLIPPYPTWDAATLEFDFVPTTNVITFKYVFTSEEFNEYVNSPYTNVFGFFLNGNNIALIPGTSTPVAINTVNMGNPCPAGSYPPTASNTAYFISNGGCNPNSATIDTEMDGLTVVLTATANVNPGVVNHIKLGIADASDSILDSNVFIEGGSFSSPQLTLTPLTATNPAGTSHALTAKFVDPLANPIVGKTVTFTVTGPNAQTGTGVTDGSGIATFTYTGINMGSDKIVASSENQISNDAYVTWEPSLNQPPTVNAGPDAEINEGSLFSGTGSFTDPDVADTHAATVNYGDGTEPLILTGKDFNLNHVYPDNGVFTVTVNVTDNKGSIGTDSLQVTVNNVAPVVGPVTVPAEPQMINSTVTVSSPFTDVGVLDTHVAEINFGDGTTSAGEITESDGSGTVSGNHAYTAAGIYLVTINVTDKNGGVGTATATQYVVIYDPSGGFVTGGGWIYSPLGAYVADPTQTGRANFGFVSKYQKGATVPTGDTEFQFHNGNLNFHSVSYEWLVIAGAKAQYKGSGTINGAGDYGFMLTATDSAISGGGSADKFRIKIVEKSSGTVVYDNQIGANDGADPLTEIAGGSIVIHKGK